MQFVINEKKKLLQSSPKFKQHKGFDKFDFVPGFLRGKHFYLAGVWMFPTTLLSQLSMLVWAGEIVVPVVSFPSVVGLFWC